MIEIYNRTEDGKDRLIATFETYHEFFRGLRESDLKAFGYTEVDRTDAPRIWSDANRYHLDNLNWMKSNRNCYLAYEDCKHVTPDRLVGLYRAWWDERPRMNWYWRGHGWTRNAWGGMRRIRTTNERRQIEAWKDEEDVPKVRAARNYRNLPNSWDDYMAHSDRSWKTQSKRKHQWK